MLFKIYILAMVGIVLGGFGSFAMLEVIRSYWPYKLFQLHVTCVTRGWYRVKHKEGTMTITSCFVKTVVSKKHYLNGRIRFDVGGGFTSLFDLYYLPEQKKIEEFDCKEAFAKGMNRHNFEDTLHAYIVYVLMNEEGKKCEKTIAVEKMKGLSFSTKKEKTIKKGLFSSPKNTSERIHLIVEKLNVCVTTIHKHYDELDTETQHTFDTLIQKRIPNLLPYATQHEEKVQEVLTEALHKLEQWCAFLQKPIKNDFEKELLLLQKTLQK